MTTWPQTSVNTDLTENNCFGCGQNNPIGLKLSFRWDGKTTRTEFTATELYQGWPGLLHGGITACLLDEATAYAARHEGVNCVTARMQVEFKQPIPVNEPLLITSSVTSKTRKLVRSHATISLTDGTLVAEGTATQFVVGLVNREDEPKSNVQE